MGEMTRGGRIPKGVRLTEGQEDAFRLFFFFFYGTCFGGGLARLTHRVGFLLVFPRWGRPRRARREGRTVLSSRILLLLLVRMRIPPRRAMGARLRPLPLHTRNIRMGDAGGRPLDRRIHIRPPTGIVPPHPSSA